MSNHNHNPKLSLVLDTQSYNNAACFRHSLTTTLRVSDTADPGMQRVAPGGAGLQRLQPGQGPDDSGGCQNLPRPGTAKEAAPRHGGTMLIQRYDAGHRYVLR